MRVDWPKSTNKNTEDLLDPTVYETSLYKVLYFSVAANFRKTTETFYSLDEARNFAKSKLGGTVIEEIVRRRIM